MQSNDRMRSRLLRIPLLLAAIAVTLTTGLMTTGTASAVASGPGPESVVVPASGPGPDSVIAPDSGPGPERSGGIPSRSV